MLSVVFFVSKRSPHLSTASLALLPLQRSRSRSRSRARSGGGAASVRCKPSCSTEKPGDRANGSPFRERGEKARRTRCKSITQQRRKIEKTVVRTSTKQESSRVGNTGTTYFPARKDAASWKASCTLSVANKNFACSQCNGQKQHHCMHCLGRNRKNIASGPGYVKSPSRNLAIRHVCLCRCVRHSGERQSIFLPK